MEYLIPILILLVMVGSFVLHWITFPIWIQAMSAGVQISPMAFIGMRLRRVPPNAVIDPLIMATQAGLPITRNDLEAHILAGGDVFRVVKALIEAHNARIPLDFQKAAAIDLAGRDVLEAVAMSVNPKVIQTPPVMAMAQDGIQVRATCRITVKANIEKLVGGAGEDTILARVGEGVVTTIGSSATHKVVLGNPNLISQTVLSKGLDAGTAFEILSIDIADFDVGRNIGAQLQIDQAEADKQIAQAHAEQRRADAVAREEEMRAQVEESRAKVVEAEARVPRGLAEALRAGRLRSAT